jgi:hypothetical protein
LDEGSALICGAFREVLLKFRHSAGSDYTDGLSSVVRLN